MSSSPPQTSIELIRDWTLTEEDIDEALRRRGDLNRLRFALQLCHLRSRGKWIRSYPAISMAATNYVARQLSLPPIGEISGPARRQTETQHRAQVREHLGFTNATPADEIELVETIRAAARSNPDQDSLLQLAEAHLRERRIIQPGASVLERLLRSAAAAVDAELFDVVAAGLSPRIKAQLDELLLVAANERASPLIELRAPPSSTTARSIIAHVRRFELVVGFNVDDISLHPLTPAQIRGFYGRVVRLKAQQLQAHARSKRYTLMACFVVEARARCLDQLVTLTDRFLIEFERKSKKRNSKRTREAAKAVKVSLPVVLNALARLMTSEQDPGETWKEILDDVGEQILADALANCRHLEAAQTGGGVDEVCDGHSELKKVLRRFLTLPLAIEPGSEPIAKAIEIARKLSSGEIRRLPEDAPLEVIPARWRTKRPVDRKLWEVGLAFTLRDMLRAGDIYIPKSRQHASLSSMLLGDDEWSDFKRTQALETAVPLDAAVALEHLVRAHADAVKGFDETLAANPFADIVDGRLKLRRDRAALIPKRTKELRDALQGELPLCRIETILLESDEWTRFCEAFTPMPGSRASRPSKEVLLAALAAHGLNLDLTTMAGCTENVTLEALRHTTRWFIRQDTLKAANRRLINFLARTPLAQVWGDGGRSSSDGQRFGVQARSTLATYYPRYFGHHRRAVSIYTHVSDHSSVFATEVISCGPNEAPFVLDGLLGNDSDLDPQIHSVDTGGSTEQLFGLCYLLGFSFQPRLANLTSRRLYRVGANGAGSAHELFKATAQLSLIQEQWDQLLRVAASLKARATPAHVLVRKLSAGSRTSRLAKALRELGRLVETIYILRYLTNVDLRRAVHRQLNRGESRHALAKHLRIGNNGTFRSGDIEQLVNRANALSLLSNAVVLWNTINMQTTIERMRAAGQQPECAHLAQIAPLAFKHILPFGTYRFTR